MKQIMIMLVVFLSMIYSAAAIDVYGYVQDTSGAYLQGVQVDLYNQTGSLMNSTNSTSTGFYNLTVSIASTGIYALNYSKVGYTSFSQGAVLLFAGQNKEVNTTLGPPLVGTFTGLIFNVNTLAGINGATVLLQGPAVYVVTTDSAGVFTANVAPGTYSINASMSGYYDNWASASVANNQTVTQNIGLTPIGDTIPPNITNVTVSSITQTSAVITWNTNENANSNVRYGTNQNSLGASVSDSTYTQVHSMTLSGLSSGTTYYFNSTSADAAGNLAVSGIYTFSTQPTPSSGGTNTGGGGGGGGGSGGGSNLGGGGGVVTNAKVIDFCQSNPYLQPTDSKDVLRFAYAGTNYFLSFGHVDSENVTLNLIPGGPFAMKSGSSLMFDLDGDKTNDVEIGIGSIDKTSVPSPSGTFNFIKYTMDLSVNNMGDLQCPQKQSSQPAGPAQQTPVEAIASGIKNGILNIVGTISPAQKANPLVGSAISGVIVIGGLALFFAFRKRN